MQLTATAVKQTRLCMMAPSCTHLPRMEHPQRCKLCLPCWSRALLITSYSLLPLIQAARASLPATSCLCAPAMTR